MENGLCWARVGAQGWGGGSNQLGHQCNGSKEMKTARHRAAGGQRSVNPKWVPLEAK